MGSSTRRVRHLCEAAGFDEISGGRGRHSEIRDSLKYVILYIYR